MSEVRPPRPNKNTTLAGYGYSHQKLRAKWKKLVDAGQVDCSRCDRWIQPGTPFHLGHDDHDRSIYTGPEHAHCNTSAAAQKINRLRRRQELAGIKVKPRPMEPRVRNCVICGVKFRASRREQRACSRPCGVELQRRNAPPRVVRPKPEPEPLRMTCVECGAEFTTASRRTTLCGDTCREERQRRYMREYYHRNPEYKAATIARAKERNQRERNSRNW